MNRKEYYKKWREENKEHIKQYKKDYAKTHDSSFKKMQLKNKKLQQALNEIEEILKQYMPDEIALCKALDEIEIIINIAKERIEKAENE